MWSCKGRPESDSGAHAAQRENGNRDANTTYLLPLSARSAPALQSLARSYHDFLIAPESTASLHDICYAASARRSHHEYRLAATGNSAAQLAEGLEAFIARRGSSRAVFRPQAFRSPEKTGLRISRAGLAMVWDGADALEAGSGLSRSHRTL